jgi:hypothetical protein
MFPFSLLSTGLSEIPTVFSGMAADFMMENMQYLAGLTIVFCPAAGNCVLDDLLCQA